MVLRKESSVGGTLSQPGTSREETWPIYKSLGTEPWYEGMPGKMPAGLLYLFAEQYKRHYAKCRNACLSLGLASSVGSSSGGQCLTEAEGQAREPEEL